MGSQTKAAGSVLLVLTLVAALMGSMPETADAWLKKGDLPWLDWIWCFPMCLIEDTVFYDNYSFCMRNKPENGWLICGYIALEWSDLQIHNWDP